MSGDANSFVEPSIGAVRRYSTAISTERVGWIRSSGSSNPSFARRTLSGWRQLAINTKAAAPTAATGRTFLLLKIAATEQKAIARNNKAGGRRRGVSRLTPKLAGGIVKKKMT